MSTSPMGAGGVPPNPRPTELEEAIAKLHAAMYAAGDCLHRAGDGCDFNDWACRNLDYADRQLTLAAKYIDKARIAIVVLQRECNELEELKASQPIGHPMGGRPLFPAEMPYEGGGK